MKILNKFIKATEALEEYLGIPDLLYNAVEVHRKDFFTIDDDTVYWARKKDWENDNKYEAEIRDINVAEQLTSVLINSDTGEGNYWLIFLNKNNI